MKIDNRNVSMAFAIKHNRWHCVRNSQRDESNTNLQFVTAAHTQGPTHVRHLISFAVGSGSVKPHKNAVKSMISIENLWPRTSDSQPSKRQRTWIWWKILESIYPFRQFAMSVSVGALMTEQDLFWFMLLWHDFIAGKPIAVWTRRRWHFHLIYNWILIFAVCTLNR